MPYYKAKRIGILKLSFSLALFLNLLKVNNIRDKVMISKDTLLKRTRIYGILQVNYISIHHRPRYFTSINQSSKSSISNDELEIE